MELEVNLWQIEKLESMKSLLKEYLSDLEIYLESVIFEREKGLFPFLLRRLFSFLSFLFFFLVSFRIFLYRKKWMKSHFFGVPVLSVGNLTMGGTGKTPLVELFCSHLIKKGWKVAILSRGYKSEPLSKPQSWKEAKTGRMLYLQTRIVSDGKKLLLKMKNAGDEPYMLAKNLPGCVVLVDSNRVRAAHFAISKLECNFLILDDGMQHLKMSRTREVVLIDNNYPLGTGKLIPRGTLREPFRNISRADYIFITKSGTQPNVFLRQKIRKKNQKAPIIECCHQPKFLVNCQTGEKESLQFLEGRKIASLCGIASPTVFEQGLKNLGAKLVLKQRFPDHHSFSPAVIETFLDRCLMHNLEGLIVTEKDSVRFPVIENPSVPIYFLRIEIEILRGRDNWEALLENLSIQKIDSSWEWVKKRLESEVKISQK